MGMGCRGQFSNTTLPDPRPSDSAFNDRLRAQHLISSPQAASHHGHRRHLQATALPLPPPQNPLIARTALLHALHLSQQSKYLDLRTELIIAVTRSYINTSQHRSISSTQKLLAHDPGIQGKIWISKYASPAEPALKDAVASAIRGLSTTPSARQQAEAELQQTSTSWEPAAVEAEWTGYRAAATHKSRPPEGMSERDRYDAMMGEVKTPVTVLYFHGGAYWLMDPATHRATTKKLAKLTGGRCYSVRYRLAPQHAFPAALIDALASYLTLLYPPPGAFHEAVQPEDIVFSGESAGGNLSLALLQLLLQLRRQSLPITWHSHTYPSIPLPAGVAVNSPWMDITQSLPSCETNAPFDYLPGLAAQDAANSTRAVCAAWPSTPPRRSIYAPDAFVTHPLVTLLLADSWAGSPPLYLCTGWELLADEDKYTAKKFWGMGCGWCLRRGDGASRFTLVKARTLEEVSLDPEGLSPYTKETIKERVEQRVRMGAGVPVEGPAGEGVAESVVAMEGMAKL
ncbi:alpha/beta hydrolase fold-domain-containing protein [Bombardia bombarda]|uniref:Alpha/beta hydrolase fold-domain-containing protein n=1 Tax=Bombardia bombarda TaxID=252184 RepID=A0AA40C9E5_9PEZI|nr:alpha/beta hydrolase fold-domain-containing protein [Bombardia bombarda]